MQVYNDYELIYLVQSEQCEAALNQLLYKYKGMAYKYILLFEVRTSDFDDYLQESIILMYKAVHLFIEKFNKTFTRYYELLLRRRILYLKKLEPKYDLTGGTFSYVDENPLNLFEDLTMLGEFEQNVYNRYFVLNQKISFIAESENKSTKQIYNAIYRIKSKYKNNML